MKLVSCRSNKIKRVYKRHTIFSILFLVLISVFLTSQSSADELKDASLRLKWLPSSQFAGYYVAKEKGWYEDEGINLTINPGGPNITAENMVGSGTDTFGHAGGAISLMQASESGVPVVGIGFIFQTTPYAFITKSDSGIENFEDLKGKTISTWFTGSQYVLQGLLKKHGMDGDVNIVAQSTSMVPFLKGDVDAATVTWYDEYQVLKRKGEASNINVFDARKLGARDVPNEVIITNKKTIKEDPDLVQGFLNASLRGWKYAIEHPNEAVDVVMKYASSAGEADRQFQQDEMDVLPNLILAGKAKRKGIGLIDMDKMKKTDEFLVSAGAIDQEVNLHEVLDDEFWKKVPDKYKIVVQDEED